MKRLHLTEVASTNSYLLDLMARGEAPDDGTVVYTLRQTAGRGQPGNVWESAPGRNVAFSVYLRPGAWLEVRDQFVLSMLTSSAIRSALSDDLGVEGVSIKWPNDIYVGDRKICGILVENRVYAARRWEAVVGVGINVNQRTWVGDAPHPTSVALETGRETPPEHVLGLVTARMERLVDALRQSRSAALRRGEVEAIAAQYRAHLYRRSGTGEARLAAGAGPTQATLYPYVDVATGQAFRAELRDVELGGMLHLRAEGEATDRLYAFKEVRFVLPGGLVKE